MFAFILFCLIYECVCVSVCIRIPPVHGSLQRTEEGIISPEAGVIDSCEPLDVGTGI